MSTPFWTLNPAWREASCAFTSRAGRPQLEGSSPGLRLWSTPLAWCSQAPGFVVKARKPSAVPLSLCSPTAASLLLPYRCTTPAEATHTRGCSVPPCVPPLHSSFVWLLGLEGPLTYLPAHGSHLRPHPGSCNLSRALWVSATLASTSSAFLPPR